MKIEELAVGNWVSTGEGIPERIEKIIGADKMVMFESNFDYVPVESLRPLKFCVQFLEEIGFDIGEYIHAGMTIEQDGNYCELTERNGGFCQSVNSCEYIISKSFNAVHSLQNLLQFYNIRINISEELIKEYTYLE